MSFSLPRQSSLSSLYACCPLVTAYHFWSISEIYGQFYPIIPASFQSLHHPSLYSPSVWSWIVDFSHGANKAHTLWQFYAPLRQLISQAFYFILIFNIIAQNIFSIPPLAIPFAVFPYHLSLSAPITLLPLFSWQALPTDVAAYVALTGPKQRAACARSGWLQVTSVFINRQIPSSIWEQSGDRGREGGEEERERQRERDADRRRKCFMSFTLVHEAGHAICHVLSLLHH